MSSAADEIEEQRAANRSAIEHFEAFRGHREHLTALLEARAAPDGSSRACVLGAGNAYDLDLERLAERYGEIHLVDLDEAALARAVARQAPAAQPRLFCHAPIDLSGALDKVERWRRMQVSPEELMQHAERTARGLAASLPGPFDVVLSACVLTPLQLELLNVLGDTHRLFVALRQVLTLTHLRTLLALTRPGGRALLASDVTSDALVPLAELPPDADLRRVLESALASERVFLVAHPALLRSVIADDPLLRRAGLGELLDVWLWNNGPSRIFLVYAMELTLPGPPSSAAP